MQEKSRPKNRLQFAKSPYLLQHQHNPVDWYEWSDEAFTKARSEDKPVFLSIGYSTCHWCHVMEHESFEDPEVARLMNDSFVNIKVDREERPDIDHLYMTVCQMVSHNCGWPLTVIMTPDKKPLFVSTYIPKDSRQGRTGMLELVPALTEYWKNKREELLQSADKIVAVLAENSGNNPGAPLDNGTVEAAYQQLRSAFDSHNGGFGGKPKFPSPHNLLFLLRYWYRTRDPEALEMVEKTLQNMRKGGVFDHIGFGFHRYSTDERWFLPHFEKMLYDQAMLAMAYTETYQETGKELYARTAREILTYVLRDMTDEKGGFYSAEDADSEGEEGKFYAWSYDEIFRVLTPTEAALCTRAFSITKEGTFYDEASGKPLGSNIPYQLSDVEGIAKSLEMESEDFLVAIEAVRQKLFAHRENRIHPGKDDKVLVDWNGLMIAALAIAARTLGDTAYKNAAKKAAGFVLETMRNEEGRLLHRYRSGEAGVEAFADDYAFFIWGLLELYETTFDRQYLTCALELNEIFLADYWDDKEGGFFFSLQGNEDVLVRQKEVYDGAIPSANAVAMNNLIRISRISADSDFEVKALKIGEAFAGSVSRQQSAYTHMLNAVQFTLGPSFEVVIAGEPDAPDSQALLDALYGQYLPNKVVLFKHESDADIESVAPYTRDQKSRDGKATAYVCRDFTCSRPTTDREEMLGLLKL